MPMWMISQFYPSSGIPLLYTFLFEPRWIGITDKALASQFGGEGSSPAETRG